MSARRKFAIWLFVSLALGSLAVFTPIPFQMRGLVWLLPTGISLGSASAMGLFKENARDFRVGVYVYSFMLPFLILFLLLTVGCYVTVALGIRGGCL